MNILLQLPYNFIAIILFFYIPLRICNADDSTDGFVEVTNYRYRLNYHVMAKGGWINDPNGFSYFNGEYHLFFQHNPYGVEAANIHWGHVKSSDLVNWKYLPIALSPGDTYDDGGCFSGSAVDNNGTLTLIYTGNVANSNTTYYANQNQNIALSTDGVTFEKYSGNPVIPFPEDTSNDNFRDPKVWKHEDSWYVILGNQKDSNGRVILYKSQDLIQWEYVGVIASSDGSLGYMWECPDFFELDGKQILTMSPQGIERQGDKFANLYQTGYIVGDYSYETNTFTHGDFEELDHGHDFYALQTMKTPDGRRVAIAWMDMWESNFPEQADGWAGAMTLPRELILTESGKIQQKPIDELIDIRSNVLYNDTNAVSGNFTVGYVQSAEILINAVLEDEVSRFGILLEIGGGVSVTAYLDKSNGTFVLDRDDGDFRRTEVNVDNQLYLRIFLDKSSIEVFIGEGEVTFTSRIYPTETPLLTLFSEGEGSANTDVLIYELRNIWEGQ